MERSAGNRRSIQNLPPKERFAILIEQLRDHLNLEPAPRNGNDEAREVP